MRWSAIVLALAATEARADDITLAGALAAAGKAPAARIQTYCLGSCGMRAT